VDRRGRNGQRVGAREHEDRHDRDQASRAPRQDYVLHDCIDLLEHAPAAPHPNHEAAWATVKNQSAEVSQSPRRMEKRSHPATGSTQSSNLFDRTMNTLATKAP